MQRLSDSWRGWVSVTLALSLVAAILIADFQVQRSVHRLYVAASEDANQTSTAVRDIDTLVSRTQAAIDFSLLSADESGKIAIDAQARRPLVSELGSITTSAELGLAGALDHSIHLDARMDTLSLLAGTEPVALVTPNVISLRGTILEAAGTARVLLTGPEPLTTDQVDSMRGRLEGAKQLGAEIDGDLENVSKAVDHARAAIRWRIHLLAALAIVALGWFGYFGWSSAVTAPRDGPTPEPG